MIEKDNKGLINHKKLEGIEIEIFTEFMLMEKERHKDDIRNIEKTLSEIKDDKH